MSAQYTPGPWLAEHRAVYGGGYNTEVFSATHGVIAICGWTPKPLGDGVTGTYRDANARLIAAAPKMLAALRNAVVALAWASEQRPELSGAYDAVNAAIAEANGETFGTPI